MSKKLNDGIMFDTMGRVSGAFFSFSLVRPPVTGKISDDLFKPKCTPFSRIDCPRNDYEDLFCFEALLRLIYYNVLENDSFAVIFTKYFTK